MTSTPAAAGIDAGTAFDALITATLTYSIREASPCGCTDAELEAARDQVTSAARVLTFADGSPGGADELLALIRGAIFDPGRYTKRDIAAPDPETLSAWGASAVLVALTRQGLVAAGAGITATGGDPQ